MKISTKGRYALRMLLDLAQNQGDGYVSLKDIAQRQEVSKKYLEQIALALTQAGMLQAARGHQGGYRLLREPAGGRRANGERKRDLLPGPAAARAVHGNL